MPDVPTADMADRPTEGRPLLAATRDLWNGLHDAPHSLWLGSIMVLIVGGGLILASKIPSPFGWERHEPAELARDIGIALIIAPIVTIIYEAGTRRSAMFKEMRHYVNVAMASFVTKEVWEEVDTQIVKKNLTRRNVEITVRVLREVELADGLMKSVPDNVIVLDIEYAYDLLKFRAEDRNVEVYHALDAHMWDPELKTPCFKWIKVIINDATTIYEEETLDSLDEDGLFTVYIDLPEGQSARVISKRYENIFVPGMYTLFMPEIMTHAKEDAPKSETLHVKIVDLPEYLEADVTTWYAPHEFHQNEQQKKANEWSFNYPMFAGQGLGLIFKKRIPPVKSETTQLVPAAVVASGPGQKPEPPVVAQNEPAQTGEGSPPMVPKENKAD